MVKIVDREEFVMRAVEKEIDAISMKLLNFKVSPDAQLPTVYKNVEEATKKAVKALVQRAH